MKKIYFVVFWLCCFILHGNQTKIDSLETRLQATSEISSRIAILNELSRLHWTISFDKALEYALQIYDIAETDIQKLLLSIQSAMYIHT